MRPFTLAIAVITLSLVLLGCQNGTEKKITEKKIKAALSATNVVFYPTEGGEITLSTAQATAVKQLVQKFTDDSRVMIKKDIPGFEYAVFGMAGETFSWQGSRIYFRDHRNRLHIIQDPLLLKMAHAHVNSLGQPPFKPLPPETWRKILSELGPE